MPALFTHYEFGQRVLNKLNKNAQDDIKTNIEYYNMFNQGFDNLYYHFKWTYYKNLGIKAHKENVNVFFEHLITYIKENNLENDSKITNMVYGFINHYILDTLIHPFVNYQVQNLKISHTKIEFMLDSKIKNNNKGKIYKVLIPKLKFNKNLTTLISYLFENVHKEKNIGKVFKKSHNNSYYLYRYFITDNYGIKSLFYKLVDFILPFKKFKFSENTFHIRKFDERILNNKKEIWNQPNDKKEQYNYSYEELYNIALKVCIKLNNDAYKVIHNKMDLNVLINKISFIDLKNTQQLLQK